MVTKHWYDSLLRGSRKNVSQPEQKVIGVFAFEVASLMSKLVRLWQLLSDKQIRGLREDIVNSVGIKKLVSQDDNFLLGLVCAEMIEDLISVAKPVAMLAKRCTEPVLLLFEHEFDGHVKNGSNIYEWEFAWKKMDKKVRKMEKFVVASANLCRELEGLAKLEQTLRRRQDSGVSNRFCLIEFQKKAWAHKQGVKRLQEISPWSRTYDFTVRLLGRSLFTVFGRIRHVFGITSLANVGGTKEPKITSCRYLPHSHSVAAFIKRSIDPSCNDPARVSSGAHGRSNSNLRPLLGTNETRNREPFAPVGALRGCTMVGDDSSALQRCMSTNRTDTGWNVVFSEAISGTTSIEPLPCDKINHADLSIFCSKFKLLNAPPSTLGAAALAVHYASVITTIEKLAASPHLIGADARDDLYKMLPMGIRAALRSELKPCTKNLTRHVYDAALAGEWSKALGRILKWLAPLAYNMLKWQSEHNFMQQNLISRTNVLLVQTLYFANQAKTEAAITKLLVGLNYIWRFEREHNGKALFEHASSSAQRLF